MIKVITREDSRNREKAVKAAEKLRTGNSPKKLYLELLESRKRIEADEILRDGGYHEIYGIWFAGSAAHAVGFPYQGGFSAKSIPPGKHEGTLYGGGITIYSWQADGYPGGIILATADDSSLHQAAWAVMESGPWNPTPIFAINSHNPALTERIQKAISAARFKVAD